MPRPENPALEPIDPTFFLRRRWANFEVLSNQLWDSGQVSYLGVPIILTDSFRNGMTREDFKLRSALAFDVMHYRRGLISLFPDFHVSFENRMSRARTNTGDIIETPDLMAYHYKTHKLYITTSSQDQDVFDHEFGHHVHSYFTADDHAKFFKKQRWLIRHAGEAPRQATREDILMVLNLPDETTDFPQWAPVARDGSIGKGTDRYRYTSPFEMVAVIFRENIDEITDRIDKGKLRTQRDIINFLLKKL